MMKKEVISIILISFLIVNVSAFNFEDRLYGLESEIVPSVPINYSLVPTVNSSDFWDNLDTPSDILMSLLNNDDGYAHYQFLNNNFNGSGNFTTTGTGTFRTLNATTSYLRDWKIDGNIFNNKRGNFSTTGYVRGEYVRAGEKIGFGLVPFDKWTYIAGSPGYSADRTLTLDLDDADRTLTLSGNLTIESDSIINQPLANYSNVTFNELTLIAPTQDYKFTGNSIALDLQSQTSGQGNLFRFFSKDGDGTDQVSWALYGVGTPTTPSDFENLLFNWNVVGDKYDIHTGKGFISGDSQEIDIYTDGNEGQILLNTDGTIDFGGNINLGLNSINRVANINLDGLIYNYGDTNTYIYFGSADIFYIRAGGFELARFSEAGGKGFVTVNEFGADVDFRVEGDNDINLLFTEGETDRVGIGTNIPTHKLNVVGDVNITGTIINPAIYCESSDLNDQTFAVAGDRYRLNISNIDEGNGISMSTGNNGTNITIDTSGVYHLVAQPQVKAGAGGAGDFHMWIEKYSSGAWADISDSNIELKLSSLEEDVIVLATTLKLNQGEVLRLVVSVSDNKILLHAQSPAGEPVIPSIIFTMYRVGS